MLFVTVQLMPVAGSVTVPVPSPKGVTDTVTFGGGGAALKLATTEKPPLAGRGTWQGLVPGQFAVGALPVFHPENTKPGFGNATKVTVELAAKFTGPHVDGQLMPDGSLVTVPPAAGFNVTLSDAGLLLAVPVRL